MSETRQTKVVCTFVKQVPNELNEFYVCVSRPALDTDMTHRARKVLRCATMSSTVEQAELARIASATIGVPPYIIDGIN